MVRNVGRRLRRMKRERAVALLNRLRRQTALAGRAIPPRSLRRADRRGRAISLPPSLRLGRVLRDRHERDSVSARRYYMITMDDLYALTKSEAGVKDKKQVTLVLDPQESAETTVRYLKNYFGRREKQRAIRLVRGARNSAICSAATSIRWCRWGRAASATPTRDAARHSRRHAHRTLLSDGGLPASPACHRVRRKRPADVRRARHADGAL